MVSGKLETVGHIPREVSRYTYFDIKEEGGCIDDFVLSRRYRPSPIPSGGLEIHVFFYKKPVYKKLEAGAP